MMDQRALEALRRSGRRTDLRRAVRYMRTNPVLLFWTTAFLGIILASIFAPVVATHDPQDQTNPLLLNPGAEHWMGTDELGRDIYSRIVYGGRTSLTVGLIAVSIALIVGTTVGLVSGFAGGLVEAVMMRFIDALMAFPSILLAIFIIALLGSGLVNMMIAIGISAIPWYARTARGSTLSVKESMYAEAARAIGAPSWRIVAFHILPNIFAPILILGTLGTATAILAVAGLSFLGLGAHPPTPEWGAMLSGARNYIGVSTWYSVFPGLAILVSVLSINLIGDALRDLLDPRLRGAASSGL
jgi:peptide/nickel transport system permease protein